jgi:hypothetical protein
MSSEEFFFAPGDGLHFDSHVTSGQFISIYGPSKRFTVYDLAFGRVLELIDEINTLHTKVACGMQGISEDKDFKMSQLELDKANHPWYQKKLVEKWRIFSSSLLAFLQECRNILTKTQKITEEDMARILSSYMYLETRKKTLVLNGYLPRNS